MIDLTTSIVPAVFTPPRPAERRDEGGPAFAVMLALAAAGQDAFPAPPSEPAVDPAQAAQETMPLPPLVVAATRPVVADHATRFDARGMIAMGAGVAERGSTVPAAAWPRATEPAAPVPPPVQPADGGGPVGGGVTHRAAVAPVTLPVERAVPVSSPAASILSGGVVTSDVAAECSRPDEPEVTLAPAARPRARFATMAQGAPQLAVVALADGLAVTAAVGALSEGERHRLRDAIAATLSRYGLRPGAVTLLAMPAPVHSVER